MKLLIVIIGLFLFPGIACPEDITLTWDSYPWGNVARYEIEECTCYSFRERRCITLDYVSRNITSYNISTSDDRCVMWSINAVKADGSVINACRITAYYEDGTHSPSRYSIKNPGGN